MGFEIIELGPFLENLAREAREDAALVGRRFEFDLAAAEGLLLPIDRALLARAFENIISNALRFAPEGGLVRLSVSVGIGATIVRIDDDGPGIPLEERERAFEPFYRGSPARQGSPGAIPPGEGSGLGLYIARSIVRGHGWSIEAGESPWGGGSISIVIPEAAFRHREEEHGNIVD